MFHTNSVVCIVYKYFGYTVALIVTLFEIVVVYTYCISILSGVEKVPSCSEIPSSNTHLTVAEPSFNVAIAASLPSEGLHCRSWASPPLWRYACTLTLLRLV